MAHGMNWQRAHERDLVRRAEPAASRMASRKQLDYLASLAGRRRVKLPPALTAADASALIGELEAGGSTIGSARARRRSARGGGAMTATWRHRLAFAVAAHDLVAAGDRMLDRRSSAELEAARRHVVEVIDEALAAGVHEATIDTALVRLRAEQDRATVAR